MATWITPVQLSSLTVEAWTALDISSLLPVGASPTGIMLQVVNSNASYARNIGLRKTGSTDARNTILATNNKAYMAVGVDINGSFDYYVGASIALYLVGYFEDDAVFFDNAVNVTPATTESYQTVDITANTDGTAIGAILEIVVSTSTTKSLSIRPYGSTDDLYYSMSKQHYGFIVGVDAQERFEVKRQDDTISIFLVGYIKSGATFLTNATDKSLASAGAYADLSALPAGATGGFFSVVITGTSYSNVLREKGGTGADKDIYLTSRGHGAWVKCDSNRIVEGKVSNTSIKFYLLGYTTGGEPEPGASGIMFATFI